MNVTDEMYAVARTALHNDGLRAALEAVAPALIAQGMREAATLNANPNRQMHWDEKIAAILARAQELDPE